MRSKEVEEKIHMLKSYAGMTHKLTDNQGRPKLDQAIETVLNYISKLEKENLGLLTRLNADSLIDRDNYWRDKIRNKLIELSKKLVEPNDDRWEKDDDAYYNKIKAQILVLKELLGD